MIARIRRWLRLAVAWSPKARTRVRRSEAQRGRKRKPKVAPARMPLPGGQFPPSDDAKANGGQYQQGLAGDHGAKESNVGNVGPGPAE